MDDQPEMIRKQMDETKSQLAEKVETLELQIAESVQSTGTAVNATAEAIQETAETVNEVVQDAVQSVSHAFDLRRQIDGHPVLVLGGAVAFGYLAFNVLTRAAKTKVPPSETTAAASNVTSNGSFNNNNNERHSDESATKSAALLARSASEGGNPHRSQLKDVAVGALISIIQVVVSRSVPLMMDCLIGPGRGDRTNGSENSGEKAGPRQKLELMTDERQRSRLVSAGKVRLGNSF